MQYKKDKEQINSTKTKYFGQINTIFIDFLYCASIYIHKILHIPKFVVISYDVQNFFRNIYFFSLLVLNKENSLSNLWFKNVNFYFPHILPIFSCYSLYHNS